MADPVASLLRERSRTTAPGAAREVWVGIDPHTDVNVAAAVDEAGRTIGDGTPASIGVPTTPAGNAELLAWARGLGETVVAFAVEGTGSYGAGLTRFLQAKGHYVVEATRPKRDDAAIRRSRGSPTPSMPCSPHSDCTGWSCRSTPSPGSATWSACACSASPARPRSRPAPRRSTR